MLEKTSKNLWKSMILRRRNLDLDMVFIDPTQCWHFKPKVLKMSKQVTQKHIEIKVRAHEKQLQKPYQKQLETQRLFLDLLCQMGARNNLKIWVFFALGDHWDKLWLWNDPGGTQEQILLHNTSFCLIFHMIFWMVFDLFLELWWKIDSVTHGRYPQNSKQITSAS